MFGETGEQKIITCQFAGLMKNIGFLVTSFAFALISTDRCLFATKPLFYIKNQKPWIAVVACVTTWVISGLVCAIPLTGLGTYVFESDTSATCAQGGAGFGYLKVILFVGMVCSFSVIIVTASRTFCFTFQFINRLHQRSSQTVSSNSDPDHVYSRRVKTVFGIFGTLLGIR